MGMGMPPCHTSPSFAPSVLNLAPFFNVLDPWWKVESTWNDLMKVQSSIRILSPRLRSLMSLMTRNNRKKLMLTLLSAYTCIQPEPFAVSGVLTINPLYDRQPPSLMGQNPVRSKLPSFYCECRERKRWMDNSRCILFTLSHTKSDDVYATV